MKMNETPFIFWIFVWIFGGLLVFLNFIRRKFPETNNFVLGFSVGSIVTSLFFLYLFIYFP
uniref:Uncharacterized protein n=1 Tax=Cyphia phyteuma TaxID=2041120 RepID=A0A291F4P9_9ASTR|nr:hypothetical protein Cyp_phy1Pt0606 [Cyphia phyteuma]ATG27105.1 hypothetical protein Cyp_phy1Pt0606 [Cyphia phyteuma]